MRLSMVKRGNALLPRTKAAQMELARIPDGKAVQCDAKVPRNEKFHRLYFAMCTYIAESLNAGPGDMEWSQESVSDRLKIATGRAEVVRVPPSVARVYGTDVVAKPSSISFAKMDETEFGTFVEASIAYVMTEFGPWVAEHPDWMHVREIVHHATKGEAA